MSSEMWKERSVLIAGCGSIGRRHARVLRSMDVRDIRICDPVAEQRNLLLSETQSAVEYSSYEEGLDSGPDAALICTPPSLHIPMAIRAMDSGAHVLSEKPLSSSLEGIGELESTIERTNRSFMVAFCFRYHEGLNMAKDMLDVGRIGRLVSIRCRMGEHLPTVRPDYKKMFVLKEVGAFDLTHEIDLACWFAGQKTTELHSVHGAFSDLGFTAPDVVELVIRFENRCLANIHLDFFSMPRMRLTELIGTEGTIAVEFASWDRCSVSLFEKTGGEWARTDLPTERDHMFRREDRDFLEGITEGKPMSIPLSEAVKSLEIVCKAQGL